MYNVENNVILICDQLQFVRCDSSAVGDIYEPLWKQHRTDMRQ